MRGLLQNGSSPCFITDRFAAVKFRNIADHLSGKKSRKIHYSGYRSGRLCIFSVFTTTA